MKRKLVVVFALMVALLSATSGEAVKASEENPAFLITDEFVFIEHVKYNLIDNKINYNGLEYELNEDSLLVAYDTEGTPNIITLPVEKFKIKDKTRIKELNELVGISSKGTRAIPSSTVNAPYTKKLGSSQWSVTSPAVNVNIPGQSFYRVLSLKITGLSWNASKKFDVHGIYGDVAGNWYDLPTFRNHDFGINNTIKWQNFTSTRYAILVMGSLSGETGYTYRIDRSSV